MSQEDIMMTLGREIGEAAGGVVNAFADGKVSLVEGLGMGKELGTLGFCVYKNRGVLGENFRDGLSEAEEDDLAAGFREGFDVSNDLTEEHVEYYLSAAVDVAGDLSRLFLKADEVVPADKGLSAAE